MSIQSVSHARPAPFSLSKLFAVLISPIELLFDARDRKVEFERLFAKSDESLARMGLKREDIARHVFRDI
ncbi:DUF1127 domain-containing protein [Pseudoruegeria sp. HB172150]|uniref:DUF1127 domain-containing protein n=1 Tax=Pseudoruegeria sp. HB172150 TaxID=2721164 RepID=UPI0020A6768A|nr:DUF1127 domain-containing protein [Pseudoruegeria sp. HB172150]